MLPTCVLGDPMQAIFGFGNNRLVNWHADVQPFFVPSGALGTPWRWRNAGTEPLGQWLLGARTVLEAGGTINLRAAPPELKWVQLTAGGEAVQRMMAARTNAPGQGTVLVIGDSMNVRGRHQLTSQTPGAMAVEAVDLKDLVAFARIFNPESATALRELAEFAGQIMTGVGAPNLLTRVASLQSGRAKNPPPVLRPRQCPLRQTELCKAPCNSSTRSPTTLIRASIDQKFSTVADPRWNQRFVAKRSSWRPHCMHVNATDTPGSSIARRAVGSTLLLKGLEADVAIILEPEVMSAQHLYVALTRGAKAVVVCSSTPF